MWLRCVNDLAQCHRAQRVGANALSVCTHLAVVITFIEKSATAVVLLKRVVRVFCVSLHSRSIGRRVAPRVFISLTKLMLQAAPQPLPAALRRSHRALLAGLRGLSYELALIHRIWYKGSAQFRHMKWWAPLQRIRRLGGLIATGSLAGTVPLGRSIEDTSNAGALIALDDGRIVGTEMLWAIADLYAALWGQAPATCETCVCTDSLEKYTGQVKPADKELASCVASLANELVSLLKQLENACRTCTSCVYADSALIAHLRTPPAPMHASTCMGIISVVARINAISGLLIHGAEDPLEGIKISQGASLRGLEGSLRPAECASDEKYTTFARESSHSHGVPDLTNAPVQIKHTGPATDRRTMKKKSKAMSEARDPHASTMKKKKDTHKDRANNDASVALQDLLDSVPHMERPKKRKDSAFHVSKKKRKSQ